jgi:hypothetical protein
MVRIDHAWLMYISCSAPGCADVQQPQYRWWGDLECGAPNCAAKPKQQGDRAARFTQRLYIMQCLSISKRTFTRPGLGLQLT